MTTRTRPEARPFTPGGMNQEALIQNLERIAWLMDKAIGIPGTRFRIGLDAILGLIPVGGDVLTGLVQAALVLVAMKHYHVPRHVAFRMASNVLIDIGLGAIPIVGDLFDVVFKANSRNLRLLEPYRTITTTAEVLTPGANPVRLPAPTQRGTPWRWIIPIALAFIVALTLVLIGFITLVRWLIS